MYRVVPSFAYLCSKSSAVDIACGKGNCLLGMLIFVFRNDLDKHIVDDVSLQNACLKWTQILVHTLYP